MILTSRPINYTSGVAFQGIRELSHTEVAQHEIKKTLEQLVVKSLKNQSPQNRAEITTAFQEMAKTLTHSVTYQSVDAADIAQIFSNVTDRIR